MYTELLRGLRNSKGNVEISELCRGAATNDCAKSYSSNCINDMFQRSNDIGIKLLSIFKYLTSKNQDLIRTTLDTAVTFR